jgi:hypothetical protein
MFYTLPGGQVINKQQIVKIDENSVGDLRVLMTGNVTVTLKNITVQQLLAALEEA